MNDLAFHAHPKIGEMAEAYALDAGDVARDNFGVSLTFDEPGIAAVEALLGRLHDSIASAPSEEHVFQFAKMFGSFVGEVLRRVHGGTWGLTGEGAAAVPALQLVDGSIIWPWARAHRRILEGEEDNVLVYFRRLVSPG